MHVAINIDHIATLRNARGGQQPDPVLAALVCEEAGAVGIVCHLREDRRHIRDEDVWRLRSAIRTKLDLEMAATEEIITIACQVKPDLVTLVPERRQELTTERGIDILMQKEYYTKVVERFHAHNIPVSLFIDPVEEHVRAAAETGTDMIELHTGEYAESTTEKEIKQHLERIRAAAILGKQLGMKVNAGHGLDYNNIIPIAAISEIQEVSIGYAIIVRALEVGLAEAVRQMVTLVKQHSQTTMQ
ncbi:MAG: pyridoxine 5'-phosphate synthase [Bacteroidetes bacterium]|nr:pyridoxine 5'-phosphate synthase [Bacteroidota bacterium]